MRFTEYSAPWLVCVHRILRSSQRRSIYRQWAQKLDAAKLLGFLFHSLSWFRSDSRADHVAAGYCSWRKKQKRKKTLTSFVDGQTDGRNERLSVGSLGSERDRDGRISKRSRRRVEGLVLHKKSLVVRDSCLLETKTLVVLFQVIRGKCEVILQLTSTSSPPFPFPHSLLCFVFLR